MEPAKDDHQGEQDEPAADGTPTAGPDAPASDETPSSFEQLPTRNTKRADGKRFNALDDVIGRMGATHVSAIAEAARKASALGHTAEIARKAGAPYPSALGETAARLSALQSAPLAAETARKIGAASYAGQIARQAHVTSSLAEGARALHTFREGVLTDVTSQLENARGKVLSELAARIRPGTGPAFTVAAAARDYAAWDTRARSALESLGSARSERLGLVTAGLAAAVSNLRGLDALTPGSGRLAQYSATARLVEAAVGPGALASWRTSLAATSRLDAALKNVATPSIALTELARIARIQVGLTDWVVEQDRGRQLLGEVSGRPVSHWGTLVADSLESSEEPALWASAVTGRTNLALISTDILSIQDADPDQRTEATELVEEEVLAPWQAARLEAFADLYAVLRSFDKHTPELLDGAWDEIHRDGPAAAVKAANCVVEALDRTFRKAAPDEKVRTWHETEKRPKQEWEGRDQPPHALRAKYLARNLVGDRKLVEVQSEALAAMHRRIRGALQSIKHASQGDITQVKALLMATEYMLVSLFLDRSEPGA